MEENYKELKWTAEKINVNILPCVTVIVPLYKSGKQVLHCIGSIFRQDYTNIELIMIDDGSDDGTFETAEKYINRYFSKYGNNIKNISLIQKENEGVADTRNLGILKSNGKYIMFVDQDDVIGKDYCSSYAEKAEKHGADIVTGGYVRITDKKEKLFTVVPDEGRFAEMLVTAPWAHIYRRQFLIDNEIAFLKSPIGEDIYFNITALAFAGKKYTLPQTNYYWIYNTKSVSNTSQKMISEDVDPIYLLDNIYEKIKWNRTFLNDSLTVYFFARYIVWYMLFTFKGSRRRDIESMYIRLSQWMEMHFAGYRKNIYICRKKPDGEKCKFYLAVRTYYMMDGLKLLIPILKVFGK